MNTADPLIGAISILFLGSMFHGIFLAAILFRLKSGDKVPWFLSFTMLLLSIWIFNFLIYTTGWIHTWPHLMNVAIPVLYLAGPSLYFISRDLVSERFAFTRLDILHLIPFVAILILNVPDYLLPAEEKLAQIQTVYHSRDFSLRQYLWMNKLNFVTLIYGVSALNQLRMHEVRHPFHASYRKILVVVVALFLLKILLPPLLLHTGPGAAYMELVIVFLVVTTVHVMGYYFFRSISGRTLPVLRKNYLGINRKYKTSPLNEEEIRTYVHKIETIFDHDQPWKDASYSMEDLAVGLQIPKHHLSQVINEGLGMNFYDLVNKKRVEEVIKRLKQGEQHNYSIGGIGSDCGFNSSSTFHRAFKKYTGTTPSAYLKSLPN